MHFTPAFFHISICIVKLKCRETWHAILTVYEKYDPLHTFSLSHHQHCTFKDKQKHFRCTPTIISSFCRRKDIYWAKRIKTISWHFVVLRLSIVLNVVLASVHIIYITRHLDFSCYFLEANCKKYIKKIRVCYKSIILNVNYRQTSKGKERLTFWGYCNLWKGLKVISSKSNYCGKLFLGFLSFSFAMSFTTSSHCIKIVAKKYMPTELVQTIEIIRLYCDIVVYTIIWHHFNYTSTREYIDIEKKRVAPWLRNCFTSIEGISVMFYATKV